MTTLISIYTENDTLNVFLVLLKFNNFNVSAYQKGKMLTSSAISVTP